MENLLEKDTEIRDYMMKLHNDLTDFIKDKELDDETKKLIGKICLAFSNLEANFVTRMIFNKNLSEENVQDN